jgi:hypothetical protein
MDEHMPTEPPEFAAKTAAFMELFESHSVGKPYVLNEYREVFTKMYQDGKIQATRPSGKPIRRNSFPDEIIITFNPSSL